MLLVVVGRHDARHPDPRHRSVGRRRRRADRRGRRARADQARPARARRDRRSRSPPAPRSARGTACGSAGSASRRSSSRSPASRRIAAARSCCRDAKGLAPMGDDFALLARTVPVVRDLGDRRRDARARRRDDAARCDAGASARASPPPTTRSSRRRSPARSLLAGLVLAVFGERGIPVPVLVAGAVALAGVFVTTRTRFGRHLYAIGGNPEAARLSGIDVKRATLVVYVIVGVLTAVAGVLLAARVNGVTPGSQGQLLELDAVTAVVIGGTSLVRRPRLDRRHRARHARVRDARERHEPPPHRLQLAADLHRPDPARRRADRRDLERQRARRSRSHRHSRCSALVRDRRRVQARTSGPQVAFLLSTLQEERYQKDVKYFEARAHELGLDDGRRSPPTTTTRSRSRRSRTCSRRARRSSSSSRPTAQAASSYVAARARARREGHRVRPRDRVARPRLLRLARQLPRRRAAGEGRARRDRRQGQVRPARRARPVTRSRPRSRAATRTRSRRTSRAATIEIVMKQNHSAWSPEQALRTVEDALTRTGGHVDAILANNSGHGARRGPGGRRRRAARTCSSPAPTPTPRTSTSCARASRRSRSSRTSSRSRAPPPMSPSDAPRRQAAERRRRRSRSPASRCPVAAVRVEVVTPDTVKSLLVDTGFLTGRRAAGVQEPARGAR